MPTLYALLASSVAGWIVDGLVGSHLPIALRVLLGLIVGAFVFAYARRWLRDLKDGLS
jgi:hypothetical protein